MNQPQTLFKHPYTTYRKTTDVQRTWREFGWTPPSEDPATQDKWYFYQTLSTERGKNTN